MSYVDSNIMPGEHVVARAYLHWVGFVGPGILVAAGLSFALLLLARTGSNAATSAFLGLPIALVGVIAAIPVAIDYFTSEFAVTNRRVLVKVGLIRRRSVEILLSKVEAIQVIQGLIGRLLGYGSIVVIGTGGSHDPLHRIVAPLEFRKSVQLQIEAVQSSGRTLSLQERVALGQQ